MSPRKVLVFMAGRSLISHLNHLSIQQNFFIIFGYTKSELGTHYSEEILCFFVFSNVFMDEKHFGIYTILLSEGLER